MMTHKAGCYSTFTKIGEAFRVLNIMSRQSAYHHKKKLNTSLIRDLNF